MQKIKPLFIYAGGKTKMLKHYAPLLPAKINSYCEPFFGGGAMFLHIARQYKPKQLFINDINEGIINIYNSIKNSYNEFLLELNKLEASFMPLQYADRKKLYYAIRNEHAYLFEQWSKPKEAAVLYFLMRTSFNGIWQINKNTNNRFGTPSGLLNQKDAIYSRIDMQAWHELLQKTSIKAGLWQNAVQGKNTLHAFDPPYRHSFADYGNGFSDSFLLELIAYADSLPNVMLSNRDEGDGFFDKYKGGLNIIRFPITYTAGRRKQTNSGFEAKKATEVLLYRCDA